MFRVLHFDHADRLELLSQELLSPGSAHVSESKSSRAQERVKVLSLDFLDPRCKTFFRNVNLPHPEYTHDHFGIVLTSWESLLGALTSTDRAKIAL